MNQPYQQPAMPPPPPGAAPQPAPPPVPQAASAPAGYPPQAVPAPGYPPQAQQAAPPPVPTAAPADISAQAMQTVWDEVANEPKREPTGARPKIPDGTHCVYIKECAIKASRKSGNLYLGFDFQVFSSTVPQTVGQEFFYPQGMGNRFQLQDLSDIAKDIWGEDTVKGWAQQKVDFRSVAQTIAQYVAGKYSKLTTYRRPKEGQAYEQAFVTHIFREFQAQPFDVNSLAPLAAAAATPQPQAAAPAPAVPQPAAAPPVPAPAPQAAPAPDPMPAPQPVAQPPPQMPAPAPQAAPAPDPMPAPQPVAQPPPQMPAPQAAPPPPPTPPGM